MCKREVERDATGKPLKGKETCNRVPVGNLGNLQSTCIPRHFICERLKRLWDSSGPSVWPPPCCEAVHSLCRLSRGRQRWILQLLFLHKLYLKYKYLSISTECSFLAKRFILIDFYYTYSILNSLNHSTIPYIASEGLN